MNYNKREVIDGIDYELTIDTELDDQQGWFEYFDEESGGDDVYGEGGLWLEDNSVTDYDGCFELPEVILGWLKQFNISTEDL